MKKLFSFVVAALISVAMFASREAVPSDADLASYATGTYTMCIYNDGVCNGIVLNGTYAGWPNDADHAKLLDFVEVTGFEGWYVVSWNDTTGAETKDGGVQVKPVQLDGIGNFNWNYQLGPDAELIRGSADLIPSLGGTEVDIKNIQPGIVVIDVKSWKNNPCSAVYHIYNVTFVSPDCNEEYYVVPAISGGFNGWAQQAMEMNELKTAERQQASLPGAVFEVSFKAAEGTEYKFRSSEEWGKDWTNRLKAYDAENDAWGAFNGGANLVLGAETDLVFDLGDPEKYSWDNCNCRKNSVEIGDLYYNLKKDKTAEVTYQLEWDADNYKDLTTANIPASVTYNGTTYSVTSIGDWAFRNCSGLTSVTISNSVTSIGSSAFFGCTGLTDIYATCGDLERIKRLVGEEYQDKVKYVPLPYIITINATNGNVTYPQTMCDDMSLNATPDYGYHFVQWSDGVTDNPRTIELTQDTTFTAEFAKNTYTISTTSSNPEWGATAGDTTVTYMSEVEISAIPNYGYHFVQWNDGNTTNPRIVTAKKNKTYTATFAKDIYSITKNAEHGSISGNSSAEYLDFVTLSVTPNYGYHFTQWSDGLKDNPRIFQITSDTTFTAEFAPDRVGTCGKDLALVWSYDPANKVLTIGNAGSFTENMQFGAEAPHEMEELVIGNSVTAIGVNAFAGIETLKKITIGESVKIIGEQAFYNCVNLETIFNYRPTPTNTYSNAFDGVDKFECELYVLPSSIDMYKNAAVWRDFYYTYAIGAEETTVTTNDVTVEPQDNAATLTWPTNDNAASYTIQITKDGVLFCTLIFNANGQLIGIAFAPGRDGEAHAPAAIMTANGLQFTVTGLDSNTQYGYSVTAKDANDQTVATYSGEFTTTSEGIATGIDNTPFPSGEGRGEALKFLRDGQIFILRGEKVYTLTGAEVK